MEETHSLCSTPPPSLPPRLPTWVLWQQGCDVGVLRTTTTEHMQSCYLLICLHALVAVNVKTVKHMSRSGAGTAGDQHTNLLTGRAGAAAPHFIAGTSLTTAVARPAAASLSRSRPLGCRPGP